jgi:hypothetical protein
MTDQELKSILYILTTNQANLMLESITDEKMYYSEEDIKKIQQQFKEIFKVLSQQD